MDQEPRLESLKQLVAEAMLFGTRVADNGYQGLLPEARHAGLRQGIERLHASAALFLKESALHDIDPEDLLPLYQEVQELTLKGN